MKTLKKESGKMKIMALTTD